MAKANSKVNSVIEKLRGADSSYQSFTTPNGLNVQVMLKDGNVSAAEEVIVGGQRLPVTHLLQAAEILRLVAKNATKLCVFHGLLDGKHFGCNACRSATINEVGHDRDSGATVEEEEV